MTTVPDVGLVAEVSVIAGDAVGLSLPLSGVVMEAVPEAGVVPPPGRLPTALTV